MAYEILSTRERRIARFNITGREYVVCMGMPEEGLGYEEVYERVHASIEGEKFDNSVRDNLKYKSY